MPCSLERLERRGDARLDVLGLVEAGDDDRDDQLVDSWSSPSGPRCVARRLCPEAWAFPMADNGRSEAKLLVRSAGHPSGGPGPLLHAHAHLHRLRLPVPAHRRWRRALVPQGRRAPRRRGPRGDLPHAAPVGPRRRSGRRRRATWSRSGRACRCTRTAAGGASSRRSCSALGVLWHLLRHGRRYDVVHTCSFPYFSLLAAAVAAAAARLPAGGRLARGVVARRTGASTSARAGGAWAGSCSALCAARAAARVLLLAPARGRLRGRGPARDVDACSRASTRVAASAGARARGAASSCSPGGTSRRSACRRSSRAMAARARRGPSCAARSSATGPSARRSRRVAEHGLEGAVARAGLRGRRGGRRRSCAARSAWSCRRAARATGWWSSRPSSHGTPSVVVAAPDNAAVELVEEGVNGFVAASDAPAIWRPRSCAWSPRDPRCASPRRPGGRPTPSGCPSAAPSTPSRRPTRR